MGMNREGCVDDLQEYFKSVSNPIGEDFEKWKTRSKATYHTKICHCGNPLPENVNELKDYIL